MIEDFAELSHIQIDALKEIGNIGAGNAATALAQLINTKIDMTVPKISILPFNEVPTLVGGPDMPVTAIFLLVQGDAAANILFMLPVASARILVDMVMCQPTGSNDHFNEIEQSALMEIGNILAATYLNAMASFTALSFRPSVPALAFDMAGAILDTVLAQLGQVGDHVLLLETDFKKDDQEVVGHFFLLPEPGALDLILAALGVNN
ncbi:MAG: chemotaxis protein CheC [Methylocystaceae bacterium]